VRAQQHATAAASYSVAVHDGDRVWREARTPLARETDGLVALSLPLSLPKVARSIHVTDLIEFTDLIEDGLPCRESFAAPLEVESEACVTLLCPATQPTKVRTCPVDIIISSSAGIVDAAPRYGGACAQLQSE
jgi:hypothetical protein